MSESSCTALGVCQFLHLHYLCLHVTCDDHLGYALTVVDDEILVREIDKNNAYLAVLTRPLSIGFSVTDPSGRKARRSIPADKTVSYFGSG